MRRIGSRVFIAIIIWGMLGALVIAGADDSRISSGLRDRIKEARADEMLAVIVQTYGDPSARDHSLVGNDGGKIGKGLSLLRGFSARMPAGKMEALARNPRFRRISLDWEVQSLMDSASPYSGAPAVWRDYGVTGAGVAVAVIDSGLDESADLSASDTSRRVLHVDMLGAGSGLAVGPPIGPDDQFGHGTHVAGIVGGTGAGSPERTSTRTFRGVAPGADLISIRALNADGSGTTSDILAALDWVIANKDAYRIGVVNLSLGHPIDESYATDPLCQAVEGLWRAGIVVVVSAGNFGREGYSSILSPGNDPYVITVGAANDRNTFDASDDTVASFSSMGPTSIDGLIKPDILASGVQIVSTRAAGSTIDVLYPVTQVPYSFYMTPGSSQASPYAAYSGTSMAAPVVAGAAALMLSIEPVLNPDTIKARLMASAHYVNDEVVKTGSGMLDIAAALMRTDIVKLNMEARSPRVTTITNPDGTQTQSVTDGAGLYSTSLDSTISGQIAIWGNMATWGQIAIWGGQSSGQIAIWGGRAQTTSDSILAAE